jgi:HAD superfamily hydrolase (TIGR01509 family)
MVLLLTGLSRDSTRPVFIFDMGGVVIKWAGNGNIYRLIAKRYGVPFSKLAKAMEDRIPILESGKENSFTYLRKSLESVGKHVRAGENAYKLLAEPFERLVKPRLGTIQIINALRKKGLKVYGLSNTSTPHLRVMEQLGYSRLFDGFFASCKIRLIKPDVQAYGRVMKEIRATPDSVVFIDNKVENIRGAKRAGITHTILFRTVPQLRRETRKILQEFSMT